MNYSIHYDFTSDEWKVFITVGKITFSYSPVFQLSILIKNKNCFINWHASQFTKNINKMEAKHLNDLDLFWPLTSINELNYMYLGDIMYTSITMLTQEVFGCGL